MPTLTTFAFDQEQALIEKPGHIILLLKFSQSRGSNEIQIQSFTGVLWKILFKNSLDNIFAGFSFFNKVDGWRPESSKHRLLHKCSFVNFAKFSRMRFYSTPSSDCFFKYYGRVFKSTLNAYVFDYWLFLQKTPSLMI